MEEKKKKKLKHLEKKRKNSKSSGFQKNEDQLQTSLRVYNNKFLETSHSHYEYKKKNSEKNRSLERI